MGNRKALQASSLAISRFRFDSQIFAASTECQNINWRNIGTILSQELLRQSSKNSTIRHDTTVAQQAAKSQGGDLKGIPPRVQRLIPRYTRISSYTLLLPIRQKQSASCRYTAQGKVRLQVARPTITLSHCTTVWPILWQHTSTTFPCTPFPAPSPWMCRFYPASRCILYVLSIVVTQLTAAQVPSRKRAHLQRLTKRSNLCVAVTCETSGYQP